MYHTYFTQTIPVSKPSFLDNALVQHFSQEVETYALVTGCYPLAEPWYSGHRVAILGSGVMTHAQLAAFEDELHTRIQQDLIPLCAAV
ncbi:MAG: hypothetical protein UX49_C0033G0003 [Candidatus Wolfebacteria bacterium GW2011_GWC2_46_275]|uniref:Uncharacterized protein n=1 Tax=Candidatus Wolfebacteria bacterium GW2011_GWB1_47_1 TaxID=1619007 RepID=A0A0G4AVL0_9BACT|nr:MAG: hypothetical protein UX70_C0001G1046 [Candidatus Wolfebacteria bacterium GW2011_GWB1_47_1]KKU34866.1 MAG: hypothetical protein UX49_C0033G0003 [Candidatus Wolfebacteria bacterium GW2011_GWC2_46_275]KKU53390.1 MAG: hypothetical protein UX76_C0018G0009 [Candidatus Wolfebacteria bacterium GW2011_GWC1_47_103]KKU71127.1 MAG: hypothetical protein UX96_C0027G0009 [Candidatus Wolfebacteria bacterium GW2011_GWB1_47_243]